MDYNITKSHVILKIFAALNVQYFIYIAHFLNDTSYKDSWNFNWAGPDYLGAIL
jgi:hypothetical protein